MKLTDQIETIPFIGNKYAILLENLGIRTVEDLLFYFPVKYIDSSQIFKFSELSKDEKRATVGTLKSIKSWRAKRVTIQKAKFESDEGDIAVTWFNQPFLTDSLETGKSYLLLGKLNPKSVTPEISSPDIEELKPETSHIGRIAPVYPLTAGIKNKWLRSRIKWLIDKFEFIVDLHDELNIEIKTKFGLIPLEIALFHIHFPENQELLNSAKKRLGFDELLEIQIKIEEQRQKRLGLKSTPMTIRSKDFEEVLKQQNIIPTKDQLKVIDEIYSDLRQTKPMIRLLQGDVGSGKTLVAVAAALQAQINGYKTVYLAPTTILSEQIFKYFKNYLGDIRIVLVNSKNKPNEEEITKADIVVGTHAILHLETALLKNMNLLIVDEEHRFGVNQREQLFKLEEEFAPHKLSMTATPIPRSLAMTIWGDTEISYIKTKPVGRKGTQTLFIPKAKRDDSFDWIAKLMKETNSQLFWVCPLISESDVLNFKSAEESFEKVQKLFDGYKVRLVHGKTKNKEEEISAFKNGEFDILVTTPIIEVGIDIPNANIMVIESAERFGLAQLHQLRGRVGRGDQEGYCLLYTTEPTLTEDQKERIKFFTKETDGLKLAEYDLKRRGPGEVYGTKQSGVPELRIADIFDTELLKIAQEGAKIVLGLV